MRRTLLGLLCLLLLAAPFLASAQTFPTVGPGGVIVYSDASVSVSNSAASTKVFQYTIAAGYIATATAVPTTGTSELYTESRSTTPIFTAPAPIHLRMVGRLRTNPGVGSAGSADLAVSFGGTTATMAVLNAATLPGSCLGPVVLDVWISPIALTAATPTTDNSSVYMAARLTAPGTSGQGGGVLCASTGSFSTASLTNVDVLGTTRLSSPTRINVEWKWSSASHTNSIVFYNRILKLGD